MKKSTIPYTVMQLKKMYEKSGILDFDCPIQRRYGMFFMYMADEAINNDIKAEDFYKWFEIFADKYNPDCAYAQYCSTGSVKKEKVEGRISVMSKDFRDYFKLNDNNNEVEETEMEESDESSEQVTESKTPLTDDFMDDLDNELPFC